VAAGHHASSLGTVSLKIAIGNFSTRCNFHVVDLVDGIDCILGETWLRKHKAILNYESRVATVFKHGKAYDLRPTHVSGNTLRWSAGSDSSLQLPNVELLSYAEAVSILKAKGDMKDWLFLTVKADEVQEPSEVAAPEEPWLDDQVQQLVRKYGDTLFQECLPHIREDGDPIEAVPLQPGTKPICRPMFRYSPQEKEEIEKQVQELLRTGLLEPSSSPWASCALIAPKYDANHC
jgi:hypothetical protein